MPLDPGCSSTSQPVNMAHSVAAQMSCLALTGPGLAVWPLLTDPLFCLRINGLLQLLPHEDNSGRLAFVRRLFLHHSTINQEFSRLASSAHLDTWPKCQCSLSTYTSPCRRWFTTKMPFFTFPCRRWVAPRLQTFTCPCRRWGATKRNWRGNRSGRGQLHPHLAVGEEEHRGPHPVAGGHHLQQPLVHQSQHGRGCPRHELV